jgi:hypothetical protein
MLAEKLRHIPGKRLGRRQSQYDRRELYLITKRENPDLMRDQGPEIIKHLQIKHHYRSM